MHITNDLWLNFKLAQRAVEQIPGADLIAEESSGRALRGILDHQPQDTRCEIRSPSSRMSRG